MPMSQNHAATLYGWLSQGSCNKHVTTLCQACNKPETNFLSWLKQTSLQQTLCQACNKPCAKLTTKLLSWLKQTFCHDWNKPSVMAETNLLSWLKQTFCHGCNKPSVMAETNLLSWLKQSFCHGWNKPFVMATTTLYQGWSNLWIGTLTTKGEGCYNPRSLIVNNNPNPNSSTTCPCCRADAMFRLADRRLLPWSYPMRKPFRMPSSTYRASSLSEWCSRCRSQPGRCNGVATFLQTQRYRCGSLQVTAAIQSQQVTQVLVGGLQAYRGGTHVTRIAHALLI